VTVKGVDLERDRFDIAYDPRKATPAKMLETIRGQGFQGKVVEDAPPARSEPAPARRDLALLPPELQGSIQEARRENRPLLLAFHAPG
jgi:hypothetical protein